MSSNYSDKVTITKNVEALISDVAIEFASGSDRGSVLLVVSGLDYMTKTILASFFIDDQAKLKEIFEGTGPLSSFSSRIKMCEALGLISNDEAGYLNRFRSMRNDFAHKFGIALDGKGYVDRCRDLHKDLPDADPEATEPRSQLRVSGISLITRLAKRIQAARDRRCSAA